MFCGLPVSVATLPALEAKASARRYGSGGSRASSTSASTMGVHIKQMVSFTSSAESPPATATMARSNVRGPCARSSAAQLTQRKIPARAMSEVRIIIPSRRTRVSQLIASR